jgi:DNA-binding transcriptional ArsR family regulator
MDLLRWLGESWILHALAAALELGLHDALDATPRSASELAERTGSDPSSLTRLLRALAAAGAVDEPTPDVFQSNDITRALRIDATAAMIRFATHPAHASAWRHLAPAIRTGGSGFFRAHGSELFEAAFPDLTRDFFTALKSGSNAIHAAIAAALDLSGVATICDLGGADGALGEKLRVRWPALSTTVVDRTAGFDLRDRSPPAADVYLLCSVLHDLDDAEAAKVLAHVRAAMKERSRLVVIDPELDEASRALRAQDLVLLVLTGGKERTRAELEALFSAAGFTIEQRRSLGGPIVMWTLQLSDE